MTVVSNEQPKYNVVFDIDGVVATRSSKGDSNSRLYLRESAIFTAINTTHYICPGIIELIQGLHKRGDVRISFFSSAVEARNVSLVKDLMMKALGQETYSELEPETRVKSRPHLKENGYRNHNDTYGIRYGNKHKDIKHCLDSEDEFVNAVLIEDDSSYIAPGQEKNALVVPKFEDSNFRHLSEDKGAYDGEGKRFIPLYLVHQEVTQSLFDDKHYSVIHGSKIFIHRSQEGNYELFYCSEVEQVFNRHTLNKQENSKLIDLLESYFNKKAEQRTRKIDDEQLETELYNLVESLGGMTKKICKKANSICYLAGLIFSAIETAEEEKKPLSEVLFRWQFKKVDGADRYEPQFGSLWGKERFYHIGLAKLREINPEFRFHTQESYKGCTSGEFTKEELDFLAEMKRNEHDDCVIM